MTYLHDNRRWKVVCDDRTAFLRIIAEYWPDTAPSEWHQQKDPRK
jgi:hypothetical protein